MLDVMLPLSNVHVDLLEISILGFVVGVIGGFFGVGGGFLITPFLNVFFSIPYNIAVGSTLAQMVGLSTAATIRHGGLGNIDYKLGAIMIVGAPLGIEGGAQILELLKNVGSVTIMGNEVAILTLVMSGLYAILSGWIGVSIWRESRRAINAKSSGEEDNEPKTTIALKLRYANITPMISLPASGIESISLWIILAISVITGFMSGLLGWGGGLILMPTLIYIIGCPTMIAIGTSLFRVVFSSIFGALTHSLKGNVDILLVIAMIIGSTVGSQIGASLTKKAGGPRVRMLFSLLAFFAVILVMGKLLIAIGVFRS